MSRRLIDVPDGADVRHATEVERITNSLQAMSSEYAEDATEPRGPVSTVFNIVSRTSEFRCCDQR